MKPQSIVPRRSLWGPVPCLTFIKTTVTDEATEHCPSVQALGSGDQTGLDKALHNEVLTVLRRVQS